MTGDMTDEEIRKILYAPRLLFKRCETCGELTGGFMAPSESLFEYAAHLLRHGTVQTQKIHDFDAPLV